METYKNYRLLAEFPEPAHDGLSYNFQPVRGFKKTPARRR